MAELARPAEAGAGCLSASALASRPPGLILVFHHQAGQTSSLAGSAIGSNYYGVPLYFRLIGGDNQSEIE